MYIHDLECFALVPSKNELGVIFVVPYMESDTDLDSSAMIVYPSVLESLVVIEPIHNELNLTMLVPYVETNLNLDSSVVIVHSNSIDGTVVIEPVHNDLSSQVTILELPTTVDLDGTLWIPYQNEMNVQFFVPFIQKFLDLDSSAVVVHSKDVDGSAWIEPNHRDIEGYTYVPFTVELNGTIWVAYQNEIDLTYKLVQAPITVLNLSVNNDVYLREARPTINYGTAESLIVGSTLEGEYKSLIQINIQEYLDLIDEVVVFANLVLNLSSESYINPDLIIDVYEVKTAWQENNVTWQSELEFEITPIPINNFTVSTATIQLNIRDYIQQLKATGTTSVNLLLKARTLDGSSVTYFHSKDSLVTQLRPYIEIDYNSTLWSGSSDDTILNGSVVIKRYGNKDVYSSSTPRFNKSADLFGTVLIGKWSQNDFNSGAVVPYYDYSEIDSTTDIYIKTDLGGSALINTYKFSDLDSSSFVLTYTPVDLLSQSNIFVHTNLGGSSNVRLTQKSDIDALVDVRGRFIFLDSSAIVSLDKHINLDSSGIIRLTSKIDLSSEGIIYYSSSIYSDVVVRHSEFIELIDSAIPRITDRIDLASSSNIYHMINLLSDAIARRSDIKELIGSVIPRITDLSDLSSSTDIYNTINLLSDAIVRITDKLDLNSLIYIWQKLDLESSVELRSVKNLISELIIRQKGESILGGDVIIRQFDVSEINPIVEILRASSLIGYALIRRIERFYLDCSVTIITGARYWIPNVHAPSVFTFTTGTLPRRWKRDDFIT